MKTKKNPIKEKPEEVKETQVTVSLNVSELQVVARSAGTLKVCPAIKPFSLSRKLHQCQKVANDQLVIVDGLLTLINERAEKENPKETEVAKKFIIEEKYNLKFPIIKETEFDDLEISGSATIFSSGGASFETTHMEAFYGLLELIFVN